MEFNIESEYQKYLELVGLNELEMPPLQRMETRRAFVAGYGMCFRQFEVVSDMSDAAAMKRLSHIETEVSTFFNNQAETKPRRKRDNTE